MQTVNMGLELLLPHQTNKEIILNETLLTVDQLLTNSVLRFIAEDEMEAITGSNHRFIVQDGDNQGKIACFVDELSRWRFITPKAGMVLFVVSESSWFCYTTQWQKIDLGMHVPAEIAFTGIAGDFNLNPTSDFMHFVLNADVNFTIAGGCVYPMTLIFKQNHVAIYNVIWSDNILWEGGVHQITQIANRMDIIELYPLPETDHVLARVIGQNYQY